MSNTGFVGNEDITSCESVPEFLDRVVFHPDFTFSCASVLDDSFVLHVNISMRETDDAPKYEKRLTYGYERTYTVTLAMIPTTDHLLRKLIEHAKDTFDDMWEHDAREFLRVRTETFFAPFHPHHYGDQEAKNYNDGNQRYRDAGALG